MGGVYERQELTADERRRADYRESHAFGPEDVHPVIDTESLVHDPTDDTKQMRIDVGAVAAATVRTLTMPDQDIDLTPNTGDFPAANNGILSTPTFRVPKIIDSALDHYYTLQPSDLAADRNLTLPLLTADDTIVVANLPQTLDDKTFVWDGLKIQNSAGTFAYTIWAAALANNVSLLLPNITAAADTLVAADFAQTLNNKTFVYNTGLRIFDSSATERYTIVGGALSADQSITLPALSAGDVFVCEAFAQTLTNKTLGASCTWNGNTIGISYGGTGQTTRQAAIDALTDVSAATNEHVLTKDTATGNAIFKAAAGGGGSNALLDGTNHTDTLAGTVTRGDIIVGNATPKWAELALGTAGRHLYSDGTDVSWGVPVMAPIFPSGLHIPGASEDAVSGGLHVTASTTGVENIAGLTIWSGLTTSHKTIHLYYRLPAIIPAGTLKFITFAIANLTSSTFKMDFSTALCADGENPGGKTLSSAATGSVAFGASDADDFKLVKVTSNTSPSAGTSDGLKILILELDFYMLSGSSAADITVEVPKLIWE